MTIPRWIPSILFCILLIVGAPVSALQITANSVSSYSVAAEDGYVIYEIIINNLPIGTNQTHVLNYNGQSFLLEINTYSEYGLWKNADITFTMPNGTVQTAHTSATTIVGDYKTTIQPVFAQAQSLTVAFLTVDLTIGLSPASAQFSTSPLGWSPKNAIPFSSASGNFGAATDVYVTEMTTTDFQNNVVQYNPVYGLTNLGSQVFQWTWNGVLGFINMIPVIGPVFVQFLDLIGTVLPSVFFWLYFVVANFPMVLCGAECLIFMMAVINAGKGKNSLGKLARNVYQYNVAFVVGVIALVNIVKDWSISIVQTVAAAVSALKPI